MYVFKRIVFIAIALIFGGLVGHNFSWWIAPFIGGATYTGLQFLFWENDDADQV